ncbi:hypothetical protein ACIPPQ_16815 [Sphingopyxis sp. LARHCG72]
MSALILSILDEVDRPLTAYAIQAQAAATGVQLYPTQIYRTVRRLVAEERVTRIETANAYLIRRAATDMIAICSSCGRAFPLRLGSQLDELIETIGTSGFSAVNVVIEAMGQCRDCVGR